MTYSPIDVIHHPRRISYGSVIAINPDFHPHYVAGHPEVVPISQDLL
jgi:hypothetical protein